MILADSGEVAAVVDRELCTLGDPLARMAAGGYGREGASDAGLEAFTQMVDGLAGEAERVESRG